MQLELPRSETEFIATNAYYTDKIHRTLSHFVKLPENSLLHLQCTSKLSLRERSKADAFGRPYSQEICTGI